MVSDSIFYCLGKCLLIKADKWSDIYCGWKPGWWTSLFTHQHWLLNVLNRNIECFIFFLKFSKRITESSINHARSLGFLVFDSPISFNKLVIQKVCFIQFLQSYKISSSGFLSIWFEIMHKYVSLILNTYSQYFLSDIIFSLNFNLVFRRYWRESMELKT